MAEKTRLQKFLFPDLTRTFLLRAAAVALGAYLFFGFALQPLVLRGRSMEPTYRDGSVTFCWAGSYLFHGPRQGDVVAVRLAGRRVVLLKRVVALAGQTVAFVGGVLYVDGTPADEPYLQTPCAWDLERRTVEPGCVYVVGDNRDMPIEQHDFGQTPVTRILGKPIW
jgi:signal peptidase I